MLKTLTTMKEMVVDILLPKFCLGCGKEGQYICKNCELFLSEVNPDLTPGVKSVWEYEGIIEKAIHKIKFEGCYDIINELVEKALEKVEFNLPPETVITYVPMWPKREKERGFNQAELIARKLSRLLSLPIQPLLEKVRDNRTQVGLNPKEREENVRGVFRTCSMSTIEQVLLVDDVYTTGATARECVKVLRKAGVKNVWVFTIARKLSL